jgi:glycosidase
VDFYTRLMHLKRDHPALQNGSRGGALERISTSHDDAIYAFSRSADGQEVVVVLNLSDQPQQEVILQHDAGDAVFQSLFENHEHATEMALPPSMSLDAWEYHVFFN